MTDKKTPDSGRTPSGYGRSHRDDFDGIIASAEEISNRFSANDIEDGYIRTRRQGTTNEEYAIAAGGCYGY